ncbi:MAG TPA: aspartate-semialdehyde dehydrogenase [Actinomycetota bacterium]|nr:aspartate-semialdehyde dehydrogenase [Actinomycetota bacterium]
MSGSVGLPANPRVAVVGATGVVGRVMLGLLEERSFPASEVIAVASARSAGRKIPFAGGELTVKPLEASVFQGVDLVVMDTPDEIARQWAPVAAAAGAIVVDNSAAWRMDDNVPLVCPEVNTAALAGAVKGIVASPNCTTLGVVVPLGALHQRFGLEKVVVSSYQSVSGAGAIGIDELREQVEKLASQPGAIEGLGSGAGLDLYPPARAFPAPIAFNAVPRAGSPRPAGYTSEEVKLDTETRKIMGLPNLQVTATCVRVPTIVGHGASVWARFTSPVDVDGATEALAAAPGVEVVDLPTPLASAGRDPSMVGRIRPDLNDNHALCFFCACDNLRKGAALNAVQIAEALLPR